MKVSADLDIGQNFRRVNIIIIITLLPYTERRAKKQTKIFFAAEGGKPFHNQRFFFVSLPSVSLREEVYLPDLILLIDSLLGTESFWYS